MKGNILGFDGENGAISAEDGARYSFTRAAWKGDRLPQTRDNVDFVVTDGVAQDVYLVQSQLGATLGNLGSSAREKLAAGGAAPDTAGARTFIAERPQVIVEGVVLLSALFLTFASGALTPAGSGYSAVGFPGVMNQALTQFTSAAQAVAQLGGGFGQQVAPAPATGGLQFAAMLSYLLYLIPIGAAFAIFRDVTGKRMPIVELVLGALCIGSLAIFYLNINALGALMGPMGGMVTSSVGFGFGGYILVLCGIVLVLTGLGRIKRTPGL